MITRKWIKSFIALTTKKWAKDNLPKNNILPDTGWLNGMSTLEIKEMERSFGFKFPKDVKTLLSVTKGLDKKQRQVGYVGSKETIEFAHKWHLTPDRTKNSIELKKSWLNKNTYKIIVEENLIPGISQQAFFLLPIYSHRFVVCDQNNPTISAVLSIYGEDIVIYGKNLQEYLENEFLISKD